MLEYASIYILTLLKVIRTRLLWRLLVDTCRCTIDFSDCSVGHCQEVLLLLAMVGWLVVSGSDRAGVDCCYEDEGGDEGEEAGPRYRRLAAP